MGPLGPWPQALSKLAAACGVSATGVARTQTPGGWHVGVQGALRLKGRWDRFCPAGQGHGSVYHCVSGRKGCVPPAQEGWCGGPVSHPCPSSPWDSLQAVRLTPPFRGFCLRHQTCLVPNPSLTAREQKVMGPRRLERGCRALGPCSPGAHQGPLLSSATGPPLRNKRGDV